MCIVALPVQERWPYRTAGHVLAWSVEASFGIEVIHNCLLFLMVFMLSQKLKIAPLFIKEK
jgi:hypothetical protein